MVPRQLAFDVAEPAPGRPCEPVPGPASAPVPGPASAPVPGPGSEATPDPVEGLDPAAVRHRQALVDFLEEVTGRVRAAAGGDEAQRPDARPPATLRHTIRNAQLIAARARRAIDALPGTDLGLLRAHGRLMAAVREAHEARLAAEFAAGGRIFPRGR